MWAEAICGVMRKHGVVKKNTLELEPEELDQTFYFILAVDPRFLVSPLKASFL